MFETHRYDVLKETWIYHEIKQMVEEEAQQRQSKELTAILMNIVDKRFPRLKNLTQQIVEQTHEYHVMHQALCAIGQARGEKEAREYLITLQTRLTNARAIRQ